MTASTVSRSRFDGATWPPMEPISALITLRRQFHRRTSPIVCATGVPWHLACIDARESSMPVKQFQFHADARQSILRGASILADAVRVTLGPKSKSVLIEKKFGRPLVCDDGVTIAKEVELRNPEENLGAQMVREAAERTGEAVGDGTTTSTLLAHAILAEGVRNVAAGASAVDLKAGTHARSQSGGGFPPGAVPPGDQSA